MRVGLGTEVVRADPDDCPRSGPFAVDAGAALDALRLTWGSTYDVGFAEDRFLAYRLTGGPVLSGATPDELAAAIAADWSGA